jgi:two-component system, LuxR family, response regulator FixJ
MLPTIYVVDSDSRRRARLSREFAERRFHAEIFDSPSEFAEAKLNSGYIFAADEQVEQDFPSAISAFVQAAPALPLVLYAPCPQLARVVSAIKSGVFDYLEWPFEEKPFSRSLWRLAHEGAQHAQWQQRRQEAYTKLSRLTRRERDVLVAIIRGSTNRQIGEDLGISTRTVEIHRKNMMLKLGATTAADATRIGLDAGLKDAGMFVERNY